MPSADHLDDLPQDLDALGEPFELVVGDAVVRGVAGIDIGLAEQFEAAPLEAGSARPGGDEALVELLALRAQEAELVRLGAVQRRHQQEAMVEALSGLMERKCRIL